MKIMNLLITVRKHWFILALILAVLVVSTIVNDNFSYTGQSPAVYDYTGYHSSEKISEVTGSDAVNELRIAPPIYEESWHPEIERRQIEKNAYLSLETKRGKFKESDENLRSLVKLSDSFILYENINRYDDISRGSYTVKVANHKYEFFVTQAKTLGTVLSFNDYSQDITGRIVGLEESLVKEKQYLADLRDLLKKTKVDSEKTKLLEQIANQERYIESLEDSYQNSKDLVIYSTVVVDLQEAPSKYGKIGFVGFSELLQKLVWSVNSVLKWLFGVLPWAVLAFLVWLIVRLVKRRLN